MGQRTQIYVKINDNTFLQYYNGWGYGFALIEDVIAIMGLIGLGGYYREGITKVMDEKISYLNLEEEKKTFRFSCTPKNAFLEYIMTDPKKLIRDLQVKHPNEKDIKEYINNRFENLIDGNKIKILGDNNDGGALITYNDFENTEVPTIIFFNSEGEIVSYDQYLENFKECYSDRFDDIKESLKTILIKRYNIKGITLPVPFEKVSPLF